MRSAVVEPLWSGSSLIGPLKARLSGALPQQVTGISIDTRTLAPGDLFFAITGASSDGHDHIAAAFAKGAAAAVVSQTRVQTLSSTGPFLIVDDVLASLESLACASRARTQAILCAVTGSVGKTSTKDALSLVLSNAGPTHAALASYNNHWGVPLTLARMPRDSRFGVFEIGMNHSGEITPLTKMVRPHVAIITKIAPVHLAAFPDGLIGIARAKAEIFTGIEPGGTIILNRDDAQFETLDGLAKLSAAKLILSFGRNGEADAALMALDIQAEQTLVTARVMGEQVQYRLAAFGQHMAENSLAVLLAAKIMGMALMQAAQALSHFQAPIGRGRRHHLKLTHGAAVLIDESYNANPASMEAAFAVLGAMPTLKGRKIAVLGDMLELGPDEYELHRQLAPAIEAQKIDLVFAAGERMKHLYDALAPQHRGSWQASSAELLPSLIDALHPGDVMMIKGSNGSAMGPLVKALLERFEEKADQQAAASPRHN